MRETTSIVPFNRPLLLGGEIENVKAAVQGGSLGGNGDFTRRCQEFIGQLNGRGKVFLTTSCTSALEMAAMVLDIKPGDEVIVPSYTYVSTINAWLLRGATLVYVDVDPATMNIDHSLIEAAIISKTRVIVAVHYAGVACEMDTIMSLADKYNLFVVEDAAQALTSTYKSRSLGSIGDISCFSFHETKNFTSGGQGGAISINNESLLARAEVIYDNGTNRLQFLRGLVNQYCWEDIGSNFFMSEVQAAYLWGQLELAPIVQKTRHKFWARYASHLQVLADQGQIVFPSTPLGCTHNAHLFFFKLKAQDQRSAFIRYMKANGVVASAHFVPLHSRPIGLESGRFVGEDRFTTIESQRLVRLPLHFNMTVEEQDLVIAATISFFNCH
ncbi:TDP-4-oxo-6-deoxy-D-glucose transaminase [Leptodontidium sp. MPI-SDFR-AT-0119]|nr:TDP-4-oxo-6-deoxy-D-glucose transaminase [Leptodontidium sp. MPI-SDFR-AT-0119]